jgi:hypothetical protein
MTRRVRVSTGEMNAHMLGETLGIFFGRGFESEVKLGGFRLDHYHAGLRRAFEYDGPDHYCEVGHIERDMRKNALCRERGIVLKRWPYYFQLTSDIARYFFEDAYSKEKYAAAIRIVYGATQEQQILAPGLHRSKHTPANFVYRGLERFWGELATAPPSLKSQVVKSFHIYRDRLGPGREWLLFPEGDSRFFELMQHVPTPEHVNYLYPYASRGFAEK